MTFGSVDEANVFATVELAVLRCVRFTTTVASFINDRACAIEVSLERA